MSVTVSGTDYTQPGSKPSKKGKVNMGDKSPKSVHIQSANYMTVMRFVLTEPEERLFLAERFCFRGSVEDWIDIGGPAQKLSVMLKKFIKHLGKESIFELY
jgi:hypothetical protein